MRRRRTSLSSCLALLALATAASAALWTGAPSESAAHAALGKASSPQAQAAAQGATTVMAGVGVSDATFHVGVSAGQYATTRYESEEEPAHNVDPYGQQTKNEPSYGLQSRLSAR
ncbi:MAG: hypothetical protein QOH90_1315, partial [Actinomycetota bacterium]|nr:hypothetical protein [Actinomycetota bacterium]